MNEARLDDEIGSATFTRDPYPTYARMLRSEGPIWSDAWGGWLVSRFDDVVGVLSDPETFSSRGRMTALMDHLPPQERPRLEPLQQYASIEGIIHSDPPGHTKLRSIFRQAFTRRVVEQMRSWTQDAADVLLAQVRSSRHMDVVAELAKPLPAGVIIEMMGVPSADRADFAHWADDAVVWQGPRRPVEVLLTAQDGYMKLQSYFRELLADRRQHPRDAPGREDFLTGLVRASDEVGGLDDAELVQSCVTLLIGGHETTTSLISNCTLQLLSNPDQLEAVRADSTLMRSAIEESLRYDSPLQAVARKASRDVVLGGEQVSEGDVVVAVIGAANRDPSKFDDPDKFDVRREGRQVAFGHGIHFCLGAPLARLEAPIAIGSLLEMAGGLRRADDAAVEWVTKIPVVRCPTELRVVWDAA